MMNKLSVKNICALCQQEITGFPYSWDVACEARKRAEISAYSCVGCGLVYCSDCQKKAVKMSPLFGFEKIRCPQCSNLFGPGTVYLPSEISLEEMQKTIKRWLFLLSNSPDTKFDNKFISTSRFIELGEPGIEALFFYIGPRNKKMLLFRFSEVVQILLKIDESRTVKSLEAILAGKEPKSYDTMPFRLLSADLLLRLSPASATRILCDIVVNEADPLELRQKSADILGNIKSADSVPQLNHVLANKKWEMAPLVAAAADALRKIGDIRAVDPLIGALDNSNAAAAVKVAEALGTLNDPRAIEALKKGLRSNHQAVREVAAISLKKLNWQPSEEKEEALLQESIPEEKERFCYSCEKSVGDSNECPHCHIELRSKPYSAGLANGLGYLFGGVMGGIGLLFATLLGGALKVKLTPAVGMLVFGALAISSWKIMKIRLSTPRELAVLKPKRKNSDGGESTI